MKKLFNFIKYNNIFTLAVMFVFVGGGVTFAASPDTIISKKETAVSIDNSYIRNVDLNSFNFSLKITGITQDANNYTVEYTYTTIDLIDDMWQQATLKKTLSVSKEALEGKDLGLFVSEQLSQMIDSHLAYLKEAQKIEIAKGQTNKIVAIEYSGLLGSVLSSREKTFNGYVPVIPPESKDEKEPETLALNEQPESERSKSIGEAERLAIQKQKDEEARRQAEDARIRDEVNKMLEQQNNPQPTENPTPAPTQEPSGSASGSGSSSEQEPAASASETETASSTPTQEPAKEPSGSASETQTPSPEPAPVTPPASTVTPPVETTPTPTPTESTQTPAPTPAPAAVEPAPAQ